MADKDTVVHIGENSPEYVAYRLLANIAAAEGMHIRAAPAPGVNQPTREWLLDTYDECLKAAKGYRS